jgi:hypothetical protein
MFKVLLAVLLLIVAVAIAGAHFHFNPAIPTFIILAFGLYMVVRIGGPRLPAGTDIGFGSDGVYPDRRNLVPPDSQSHSGPEFRDGAGTEDPENRRYGRPTSPRYHRRDL